MSTSPAELIPTRASLLERLKNWDDSASWKDFFYTYWKLIYGVARKAGLSDAEAQDVVQETIISVAQKMPHFAYDPVAGSFKGWLMRLTEWRITDAFRKKQYEKGGQRFPREQSLSEAELERHVQTPDSKFEEVWNQEWERHVLEAALQKVRNQVDALQFQMFHLHVIKGLPADDVARRLGVKLPAVYFSKYKVSALLQKEVRSLQDKFI
ncbi:MAG: polymerase, sigma-24 subunit, subfamily [Verrucomicrobiales bacterium]|nr:polymerase, sigma-24 subunit, subfamily [Verrucomicrobiales bacterium]